MAPPKQRVYASLILARNTSENVYRTLDKIYVNTDLSGDDYPLAQWISVAGLVRASPTLERGHGTMDLDLLGFTRWFHAAWAFPQVVGGLFFDDHGSVTTYSR